MPGWLLPFAIVAVVALSAALVIWLAARASGSDAPPQPDAFVVPEPVEAIDRFTVRQVTADRVTLSKDTARDAQPGAPIEVVLGAAAVERLVPATPAAITPGTFITVVGVPNAVRNFSIRRLIVLPSAPDSHEGGLGRSKAGFLGSETAVDTKETPVLAGTVQSVTGTKVTLTTLGGTVELTLTAGAPVYRLEASTAASIREGERLASKPFGAGSAPNAVLISPGE